MSREDTNVVTFPTKPEEEEVSPDEHARRLRVVVERLAGLPMVEWMLYLPDTAKKYGIAQTKLKAMVNATIKRVEKERAARDRKIRQDRAEREEAFEALRCLPCGEHEDGLAKLARRLGEDPAELRDEFTLHAGLEDEAGSASETWPEQVDTHELLDEIIKQVRCYAVVSDDIAITVALWTMFAWMHEVAIHSPLLVITSAEENTGKTTISGVLKFLVPRPHSAVELTGPGLFRMVDFLRPTLIIDEADQLLQRKCDLMHIINAGWTRGVKIPRIVRGEVHLFDPFCPKIISMKGLDLPNTTASRAIVCKLVPKLESEKVAFFRQTDTEEFWTLRMKLARWAADNMPALRDADPVMPSGFVNRLADNWRLLFAIADLANCGKRVRAAALRLSPRKRRSDGVRLLGVLYKMFADREVLTSAEIVAALVADEEGYWADYHGHGPITKRQVALLLAPYDIRPVVVHPGRRSTASPRGYRRAQFDDAFARFLGRQPHIRTLKRKKPRKIGLK